MKAKKVYSMLIVIAFLILCLTKLGIAQVDQIVLGNVAYPEKYTLTVTKSGSGTGTVTSSPAGIDCGSVCSFSFNVGSTVTLTATPDMGSMFVEWSGDATGTELTVNITMTSNKTVNAEFWAPPGGDCLIGWYRIDEGAGSTLKNSAPASSYKLPDLTISGNLSTFWQTLPGFGSNPSGGTNYASASFSSMDFTTNTGFGYFRRPYFGGLFERWDVVTVCNDANCTPGNSSIALTGDLWGNPDYDLFRDETCRGTFVSFQSWVSKTTYKEHWAFTFHPSSDNKGRTYFHDSTFNTGEQIFDVAGLNQNLIKIFIQAYYPFYGQIGDVMIYRNCQRTVNDWADIYDHLHSRYGMPPRTGWGP